MSDFARKFGWVLVLTVLTLFLFPLQFGSFTATHGPITALRALMALQLLMATIALIVSVPMNRTELHIVEEGRVDGRCYLSRPSPAPLRC